MNTVIVVGAGGAGIAAAIEAAENGARVTLVTKALYEKDKYTWASTGGCTWKTHAFNVAITPIDSVEDHINDTIVGGSFANNPALAETLCHGARELVDWLEELGITFERELDGSFATRPFGGCGIPRGVYLEDRLGYYIQTALAARLAQLVADGCVSVISGVRATRILLDDNGWASGIEALAVDSLETLTFTAAGVVLADGGGASMYAPSAASMDKSCDGIVLGLKAGAEVIDMEFVQFHPTGLASNVLTFDGSLVEEALRFDGAQLLNRSGKRFMLDYDPRGEMATRDVVSRGIYREIIEGRGFDNKDVRLDISSCAHIISTTYPALHERLIQAGFDPGTNNVLNIRPTAHFLMGGLRIDTEAETSIPGLFAAGETAGGVHGANRLGGNGLSECLVFGRIAGRNAARHAAGRPETGDIDVSPSFKQPSCQNGETPESVLRELRSSMYWNVGPVRTKLGLLTMLGLISTFEERAQRLAFTTGSRAAAQIQTYLDLTNLLLASRVIVEGALMRTESRGAHFRDDYPDMLNEFSGSSATLKDDRLVWSSYGH
ncbi:L-aspartate oxidase [Nocardia sp. NPDC051570]|uniref:L-aspartate oxidase n=1 Tax=Nocardia sp. NPDC051570 TaxID=3364324 RepID=UPI003789C173